MRHFALAAAALLTGCAGNTTTSRAPTAVTGHVTYRERVALPADAEVRVQLLDVSRQDVAAAAVADTTIKPDGRQVPLPFLVRFDPKKIDPRHDYAVRATITMGGQLAFTTTAVVRVITRDRPTAVDLVLTSAGPAAAAPPPPTAQGGPGATSALSGTWVLEDINGGGVMDYARATLEFREAGRVSGRGSCNQFNGPVTITDTTIAFGPLVSTMMACSEALMNQEAKYLKALQSAERYRVDGHSLLIFSKGIEKPLRFAREA